MLDCRYYDLCCFTDDSCNGEPECPKRDHCQFYSPMPDVKALTGLADEIDSMERVVFHNEVRVSDDVLVSITRRIREACGEAGA